MKRILSPENKAVLGLIGMILVVAFSINPEPGPLALGGIVLMSVLYSVSWFLPTKAKGLVSLLPGE